MSDASDGRANEPQGAIQGAMLTDDQIKRLKVAITVMTTLLIIGIITLIARVIYLASGRAEQAPSAGMVANTQNTTFLSDVKLALPAGATLKASSLQGQRLLAQYSGPRGDGLLILDLTTGKVVTHIQINPQP